MADPAHTPLAPGPTTPRFPPTIAWHEANQRHVVAALARIRAALLRQAARAGSQAPVPNGELPGLEAWTDAEPPALEVLCRVFGLSPFERDLVVLCAGVELDDAFGVLCAAAHGEPARPYPTFGLALAALEAPHWSALATDRPLRRWRLIEVTTHTGVPLRASPLRLDERVLHFLAGVQHVDQRLTFLVESVPVEAELPPSHRTLVERGVAAWTAPGCQAMLPVIQLCGGEHAADKRAIAASIANEVGLHLFALDADQVPTGGGDLEELLRLWEREAALIGGALLVETPEVVEASALAGTTRLLERLNGAVLLSTQERWRPLRHSSIVLGVRRPTGAEQHELWRAALGEVAARTDGLVGRLVDQFDLSASTIRSSVAEALPGGQEPEELAIRLWDAGRAQARPRLEDLAQRIEPVATWDDLVLPEAQRAQLRALAGQVAHRATVYGRWGFAKRGERGLGISALFAGPSGTGKTMAADVLASELRLDLYRIDLSSVVSKYIGETEKNLRRVFNAAEEGGAILLFDEADALFGKRSEVKDGHDRYANIEINYLLQRMDTYRGLAVLATNRESALDTAFLRRLRFVVHFPFPDASQREGIWKRIFPPQVPVQGLDTVALARLNVAGGNIRNIALNSAFLAAEAGEPVGMKHLMAAARSEYAKLGTTLTRSEIGNWT
jgi:hypothetical protein